MNKSVDCRCRRTFIYYYFYVKLMDRNFKKTSIHTSEIQYLAQVREIAEFRPILSDSTQNFGEKMFFEACPSRLIQNSSSPKCPAELPKISLPGYKIAS